TRPIARPAAFVAPRRSRAPVVRVMKAPTSGTAATSRPVSELDSRVSALESRIHGTAISTAANTSSGNQRRKTGRISPLAAAIGSSRSAPMPVRAKTSIAGLRSRTATLIRRYGIPQITHIAAKSARPRLVITQRYATPVRSCRADVFALELVHGSGDPAARAGADLPPRMAVRRSYGTGRRARHLLRGDGRPHAGRRDPRGRRGAACVPQRVPSPGLPGRPGRRAARDAPVRLPRVDVRTGRRIARGPALRPRAR